MKLTVLCDNASLIGKPFLAEPALSLLVEDRGFRLLFDAGASSVPFDNAARLGLDLSDLDAVALSHGHWDHTWGLFYLMSLYRQAASLGRSFSRPRLYAGVEAFAPKRDGRRPSIGCAFGAATLAPFFEVVQGRDPVRLTERVVLLGDIPRRFAFESGFVLGEVLGPDGWVPDGLPEDTGLALTTEAGLVVVTGCAHAGVCNMIEHAREVTGVAKVVDVIGGFHLLGAPAARLSATADYLSGLGLRALRPCHCTDLSAKLALSRAAPLGEVGSGLVLSLD